MQKVKKVNTKKKILSVAIKQYNEFGIQNVTSRHIAAKMGISNGNLDYHYKTKEDLILAIYEKMRNEMSESYTKRDEFSNSFQHFYKLLVFLEEFQYKYRFFNLDVLEISRSYNKISKTLEKTFELRKTQMNDLFKESMEDGFIIEKPLEEYERLQHIIRIIITFWLVNQEIITSYKFAEKGEMTRHVCEVMMPHLTDKGIEEYKNTKAKVDILIY